MIQIRRYRPDDNEALVRLFYDTVHSVNAAHYTPAQRGAWAPRNIDAARWCAPFAAGDTFVAQVGQRIAGFANLAAGGYFDRLYVHRDFIGRGVGRRLADAVEGCARAQHRQEIRVDASITAKPFFEKRGYRLIRENAVARAGETLTNYTMAKRLV